MASPQPSRSTCPGCSGRGIVVSLNTVLPCGRCHGAGTVDLVREQMEKAREDAAADARALANAQEMVRLLGTVRKDGAR